MAIIGQKCVSDINSSTRVCLWWIKVFRSFCSNSFVYKRLQFRNQMNCKKHFKEKSSSSDKLFHYNQSKRCVEKLHHMYSKGDKLEIPKEMLNKGYRSYTNNSVVMDIHANVTSTRSDCEQYCL